MHVRIQTQVRIFPHEEAEVQNGSRCVGRACSAAPCPVAAVCRGQWQAGGSVPVGSTQLTHVRHC